MAELGFELSEICLALLAFWWSFFSCSDVTSSSTCTKSDSPPSPSNQYLYSHPCSFIQTLGQTSKTVRVPGSIPLLQVNCSLVVLVNITESAFPLISYSHGHCLRLAFITWCLVCCRHLLTDLQVSPTSF